MGSKVGCNALLLVACFLTCPLYVIAWGIACGEKAPLESPSLTMYDILWVCWIVLQCDCSPVETI